MQNKIKPKMDEVEDYGAAQFSDTEETALEERRFISEEVLDEADVCYPGNCEICCIIDVVNVSVQSIQYI